jgi:hypothetical protein
MGDLLSIENMKKIIDIGIAIKEAIETARRNEKECSSIKKVMGRVCGLVHTLSVSQASMLQHPMKKIFKGIETICSAVERRGRGGSSPPIAADPMESPLEPLYEFLPRLLWVWVGEAGGSILDPSLLWPLYLLLFIL